MKYAYVPFDSDELWAKAGTMVRNFPYGRSKFRESFYPAVLRHMDNRADHNVLALLEPSDELYIFAHGQTQFHHGLGKEDDYRFVDSIDTVSAGGQSLSMEQLAGRLQAAGLTRQIRKIKLWVCHGTDTSGGGGGE